MQKVQSERDMRLQGGVRGALIGSLKDDFGNQEEKASEGRMLHRKELRQALGGGKSYQVAGKVQV